MDLKCAIVTPSYRVDLERCRLLSHSIGRYVPSHVPHYLVVAREDRALFASLENHRTTILIQEDVVRPTYWPAPWPKGWRVGLQGYPVRGWIWQQIVKLATVPHLKEDVFLFADSDFLFCRPFDPLDLVDEQGRIPLFREQKAFYSTHGDTQKWHTCARRLLRLPPSPTPYDVGYIGPPNFWRRTSVLDLLNHMNGALGESHWVRRVSGCLTFSEYILYGIFVDHILGLDASGHYPFHQEVVQNHWGLAPLSRDDLQQLKKRATPEQFIIQINAKSRTPTDLIEQVLLR